MVAATKKGNVPDKSYSNYGPGVDIAAPGTDIYSTIPPSDAKQDDDGNPLYIDHMRTSGTSQAAPLVAAAAALIKSIRPNMTPAEIEKIIKNTAYVPEGWDTEYGTGIVNFYNIVKATLRTQPEIILNDNDEFEILSTDGSHITYYTLDSSTPSAENGWVYSSPLDLSNKNVYLIKAVSYRNGVQTGDISTYRMTKYETIEINYRQNKKLISYSYPKDIKWQSRNPSVVSVDSNGNIKGISVGQTQIIAKLDSGKRIIFNVSVEYTMLQKIIRFFLLGFFWY